MFCFLFGWRKTSKCKSVVKQLQCRLKLLKNKKYAITTHYRHDIAQLIRIGERDRALHRAQQLYVDENLMSLYHLLLHFSDLILQNLSYIRRRRDLSNGINEAVSTLVFASARCGDLHELRSLRILFGERYGQQFVDTALNLLPGNCVNPQVLKSEEAEEEKEVMGSQKAESEAEVYKFTLTDADTEEKQEKQSDPSKASRDQRGEVCEEDCFIEEEVVEKDQRVFRFKETDEESKERNRSRRKTRSSSSSPVAKDMDCWRYYYKGRRSRQRRECGTGRCYHIVYNVFTMLPDGKGNGGEGEIIFKEAKHVHPKLPDYDQLVAHFTALRKQQQQKHMR
ncbi:hypothetical protein CARUB_v10016000mg [Capsella rubella]|uniref:Uncharacterized protein n=1 Tax=Capsella rubella TaxID=81985 RepID=R0GAG4_9BRAS|nr:hypothetical protein CARUB_v10016000mg [Capsella rubella]